MVNAQSRIRQLRASRAAARAEARLHLWARVRLIGIRNRMQGLHHTVASRIVSGPGVINAQINFHNSRIATLRRVVMEATRQLRQFGAL